MNILIVDDSISMRQMIKIILSGAGHTVVDAIDGNDGLAKFDETFDVVVTDFNMPQMGGVELIKAIRAGAVNRTVPILMLTTESEADKKALGRDAGATAWITKPFSKESLLATIDKISRTVAF